MDGELIHADDRLVEVNAIRRIIDYDAVATTQDMSDFALKIPVAEWDDNPVQIGHALYLPNTEWGGLVNRLKTDGDTVELGGQTWRGLLRKNLIMPPPGQAYHVITGAAQQAITALLSNHFGTLYEAIAGDAITVNEQYRYQTIGEGLEAMAVHNAARLEIRKDDAKITLALKKATDWSQQYELNEDYGAILTIDNDQSKHINHVVALGSGELVARMVIEAWQLPDGSITYDHTAAGIPSGLDCITYKLDYPNAESEDDLKSKIVDIFKANANSIKSDINLSGLQVINLELGDIIACRDRRTNLYVKQVISKKIYKISSSGLPTIRYEVKGAEK